jgi:hypothetical protein
MRRAKAVSETCGSLATSIRAPVSVLAAAEAAAPSGLELAELEPAAPAPAPVESVPGALTWARAWAWAVASPLASIGLGHSDSWICSTRPVCIQLRRIRV